MASYRIIKYAKPYTGFILLSIVLLFAQANFDLSLPNYLSDIVNTGIQQGGVEDPIPIAIRQTEMNRAMIFVDNQSYSTIMNSYQLISKNSTDYNTYLKQYPALKNESIYVLKNISSKTRDLIKTNLSLAILAKSGLEDQIQTNTTFRTLILSIVANSTANNSSNASLENLAQSITGNNTNLALIEEMAFQIIAHSPQMRQEIKTIVNKEFASLGSQMIEQATIQVDIQEYVIIGLDTTTIQNNYIIRIGLIMLFLTLLSVMCTVIVTYLAAKTAAGMARDVRRHVFKQVESFSPTEFDSFSTASLISRSTNDITQIQMVAIMVIRMVFYAPIIGIGGIIMAYNKGSSISWIIAIAVGSLMILILIIIWLAVPRFQITQKLIDRLNLVARENLSGMMVIRAFNKEQFEEDRFDKANLELTSVSLYINRLMAIMMPVMMLIMNGVSILIIWEGAHQVADLHMQVGDMIAFMQYTIQIVMAFLFMSIMLIILPRASVSADRILQVLDTKPTIVDPIEPLSFPEPFRAEIEFRNVSFKYQEAEGDVLHNISFTAKAGQTTAFIGPTGSGKTTLISLIPRLYDVIDGAILIDGVDIRNVTQHDLRQQLGLITQKSTLFSGTIESNLKFGNKDASNESLNNAISIAQATDFVTEKPEGFGTPISQAGTNVSGGQKQRLSIARAIVKNPPIFLFDDSFSALDFKTDSALRRALKEKVRDKTILIVTQRASTIRNAEQIIVMDEGKIVDKGTHEELMQRCETYKEIVVSQIEQEDVDS